MLKRYLSDKNIAFDEKLADENPLYAQELYQKSHQLGVPYTIIEKDNGDEISVLGFDKPKIDQALGLS